MEESKRSLIYFLAAVQDAEQNPKGKPSVTRIAERMGCNRVTVTRNLSVYQARGFLDSNNRLTQIGKEWMTTYTQYQERLVSWLIHNGIEEDTAKADAFEILNRCSDDVISLLCKGGHMCKECDQYPRTTQANWFGINGEEAVSELKKYFPDGKYQVYFSIYKEQSQRNLLEFSMAADGFDPHATLEIFGESGNIFLKRREMRRQSVTGQWYSGMLASLRYENDAFFCEAEIKDDVVQIPLTAFHIIYEKECKTVRGMARVLMTCSAGEKAMPESAGLLEFKLWRRRED